MAFASFFNWAMRFLREILIAGGLLPDAAGKEVHDEERNIIPFPDG